MNSKFSICTSIVKIKRKKSYNPCLPTFVTFNKPVFVFNQSFVSKQFVYRLYMLHIFMAMKSIFPLLVMKYFYEITTGANMLCLRRDLSWYYLIYIKGI